jgi:hypothetical protein
VSRLLIGAPAASVRSQQFGSNYRSPDPAPGMLTGSTPPVDHEESLGAKVIRMKTDEEALIGGAQ